MSQTIVNLTLPVVTEKINQLLTTYPQRPYQEAFNSPELHQKLMAYVLSRLPVIYVTMENSQAFSMNRSIECYSHEQHEQIEQLIHQGIDILLAHRSAIKKRQSAPLAAAATAPSNWFG